MSSVYFLFLSMHFRIKPFPNFPHRRTYGRMSVRRDSTRHCRSPLPSTESTHRHTFFIHALCVVKQYVIVLVAVTLLLHQTDIYLYALVSKVSSSLGETRSSVGKNHSTRISPSARIITVAECPSNISSGSLRARCFSRSMLKNHTDRVLDRARETTFARLFSTVPVWQKETDGRTGGMGGSARDDTRSKMKRTVS